MLWPFVQWEDISRHVANQGKENHNISGKSDLIRL